MSHTSLKAKEFIDTMTTNHGRVHCDRIVIPLSQRELARRYQLSPGTIHWYLDQLGERIITRRPFITVQPTDPVPSGDSNASPAPAGDSADAVVDAIRELTDAVEAQCELLRMLYDATVARDRATDDSRDRATAARTDRAVSDHLIDGLARNNSNHSISPVARTADAARETARTDRAATPPERVDALVAPLDETVRRHNLSPATVRRHLHNALGDYDEAAIVEAVRRICHQIRTGAPIRNPFGLLIAAATRHDTNYFPVTLAEPSEPAPPPSSSNRPAPAAADRSAVLRLVDPDALETAVDARIRADNPNNPERFLTFEPLRAALRHELTNPQEHHP